MNNIGTILSAYTHNNSHETLFKKAFLEVFGAIATLESHEFSINARSITIIPNNYMKRLLIESKISLLRNALIQNTSLLTLKIR